MSGTLKIRVEPVITGPIADGTATRLTTEWAERVTQALGDEAVVMLGAWKFTGGSAGTGRDSKGRFTRKEGASRSQGAFRANLRVVRRSRAEVVVPGPQIKGVVWSSWLEGTSQRNTSTGFKGYGLFAKTRAELDKIAPEVGQRVLGEMMPGIGGA